MAVATKRDPAKWARAKARAKAKMGGKHSARAMQLAVKYYKDAGGTYKGKKKKSTKKPAKKKAKPKNVSDSARLLEIERRTIRIEKLVMLLLDDNILADGERKRVQHIEQLVRDGNFDALGEIN